MTDTPNTPTSTRAIDLQVDVPGTPEEVWDAIASGPGIGSWFVPAEVNGGVGGTITLHFGIGVDETVPITVWEPPHRFVYADDGDRNLAYEFRVEARDGGVCTVRLVNSGFGTGADWDGEYESMTFGWKTFLANLALARTHFPGQTASSVLTNGSTTGLPSATLSLLKASLGLPATATVGQRVATSAADVPAIGGTVVRVTDMMVSLLLDTPAPGTAFLAAEPFRGQVMTSLYVYLFGESAAAIAERDAPGWRAWMDRLFPPAPATPNDAADGSTTDA